MLIFIKMVKKDFMQEIEILEGLEVTIDREMFSVKGPEGENSREFGLGIIKMEKKDNKVVLSCKKGTKREKKIMNTTSAHINNMMEGVKEKFEYILKICHSHFPMTVKIEGAEVTIKNFLGEKIDRKFKLPKGSEVDIKKDMITVNSVDKETAGQAAANFETATKIKNRDKRIFQDGIYIINKSGKEI